MVIIFKLVLLILLLFVYGCSDYQTGYREGYADTNKKQWLVFGKTEYLRGYDSGAAEKFQQDWVLENPVDSDALHCPSIIVQANTLMFLPTEYKEIASGIYSSE